MDTYQKLARDINKGGYYKQEGRWVLRKPEDDRCMVVASDYPSRYPPRGIVAEGSDWAAVAAELEQYRRKP